MSLLRSFKSLYLQKFQHQIHLGSCNKGNLLSTRSQEITAFAHQQWRLLTICPHRGIKNSIETSTSDATDAVPARLPHQQKQERAPFFSWARLAISSVLAVLAPFLHSKWGAFLRVQSEVEVVKEVAETIAEVIEEVATGAEKVSSEVLEKLPEDGKLKQAAEFVEHVSKEVAEEAHLAQDILHKVDEIEEDMKAIVEPMMHLGKQSDGKKHTAEQKNNH